MSVFVLKTTVDMTPQQRREAESLRRYIHTNLNIKISLLDMYQVWSRHSASYSSSWMPVDTYPPGYPSYNDFLLYLLNRHGYIISED